MTAPVCEHCQRHASVMLVMAPAAKSADKSTWLLCSACWIDGMRPIDDPAKKARRR